MYFTLEKIRIFISESFASLYSGYLGDTPIAYELDAILNLSSSYLRSTILLLYIS